MGLDKDDFKTIFEDGFKQKFEGKESELRCFTCGKKATLKNVGNFFIEDYKIVCEDNHEEELLDFLVIHIRMRDGVTDRALLSYCSFEKYQVDD